jgi:platelet-activating factor acetylhydrolase
MASKRPDAADPLEGDVGMPSTDAHDVVDSEAEALQPARRLGFVDRFLFFPSLPRYTGQHRVGTIDIEVPVDRPRGISGLKRIDGSDALRIDSVLMTIFYPTEAKSGKRLPWLKQPKVATATGYANFANFSRWLVGALRV